MSSLSRDHMLVRSGADCRSQVGRAVGRVGLSSEQGSLAAALSRAQAPHWGVVQRGGAPHWGVVQRGGTGHLGVVERVDFASMDWWAGAAGKLNCYD